MPWEERLSRETCAGPSGLSPGMLSSCVQAELGYENKYQFFYIALSSSREKEGHGMQTKKPFFPSKTAGKHWTIPVKLIIFIGNQTIKPVILPHLRENSFSPRAKPDRSAANSCSRPEKSFRARKNDKGARKNECEARQNDRGAVKNRSGALLSRFSVPRCHFSELRTPFSGHLSHNSSQERHYVRHLSPIH